MRRHRDTLPSLRYLIPSLQTADCSYRHLGLESLEQRVYLASDINLPVFTIIPTATMEIDRNVVIGNPSVETTIRLRDAADVIVARHSDGDNTDFDFDVGRSADNYGYVRITPKPDFSGTIKLLVGVRHAGDPETAAWVDTQTITVNVLPNSAPITTIADFTLTATKPDGSPIDQLRAGDDFILHVWSQDQRPNPKGIFAAYLNVNWNSDLAVTTGEMKNGDRFFNGKSGDLSEIGAIKEAGGFGGMAQSDGKRYEVFSVAMRATSAGELSLVASPPTIVPAHDILAHGIDGGIDDGLVQFGKLNLTIAEHSPTDEPHDSDPGANNPTDPIATSNPQLPPINPSPPLKLPRNSPADAIVGIAITATAPDGTSLKNPRVGDDFIVHVWVKDTRQVPSGVLAAFLNVNWNADLAVSSGPLKYGERFVNPWPKSAIRPGIIEEAGGMEEVGHSQGEWLELFSVPLRATADGELSFITTPSTQLHIHDILVGGLDGGIDPQAVYYGQLSLTINKGEPITGTERPPAAVSAPESPVISTPLISDAPIIVAISDDSEGGQFAVSVLELLSPEMQAEFANGLAVTKLIGKDHNSRAVLLSSANLDNADGESPLPTANREADLPVVSRKPNADGTADGLENQAITAKTDLSLL